jgi:2'-5' RNA ligase
MDADNEVSGLNAGAENKFLCVMAGYDSATELRLSEWHKLLYDEGYVGEQTKSLPQHITLGTYPVAKEMEITELVQHIAQNTSPFELTFNHVGIFGGSKVLFIAPDPNRELLALKENFGDSHNWTPHTTMLIDKPEVIYQALPIVAAPFKAFSGSVHSLYLYEFWPARFICQQKLKNSSLQDEYVVDV